MLAASAAAKNLGFDGSLATLFLFGRVDSLLMSENQLFEHINSLPFYTYIHIGLESIDTPTLAYIHKWLAALQNGTRRAFLSYLKNFSID